MWNQNVMNYLGIDGCKAGWFVVAFGYEGNDSFTVVEKISDLQVIFKDIKIALIDIPIGLRGEHPDERVCDQQARSVLKPKRNSSVFPAPSRCAVNSASYEIASSRNKECTGRGLTKQTFGIIPKIREVDEFLRVTKNSFHLREMHPEICFWALNNQLPMMNNKRTNDGYEERITILSKFYSDSRNIVENAMRRYRRRDVGRDDIVDALVGAITAINYHSLTIFPEVPELDDHGLPMEIVYWSPN
jgi:predicted RNase H-like nuclease